MQKKQKLTLKFYFFKLMNNAVFEKTIKNMRKHRDIRLLTIEARRIYLTSEPNYHTKEKFFRKFISNRNEILMNKPVFLDLSILDRVKIVIMSFGMIS